MSSLKERRWIRFCDNKSFSYNKLQRLSFCCSLKARDWRSRKAPMKSAEKKSGDMLQKEVSMNKPELLNGVREEYRQWEALLNQIGEARMDQPGAVADWSIKDIIAHLTGWRRRTVARLQAAQRGEGEPPDRKSTRLNSSH